MFMHLIYILSIHAFPVSQTRDLGIVSMFYCLSDSVHICLYLVFFISFTVYFCFT